MNRRVSVRRTMPSRDRTTLRDLRRTRQRRRLGEVEWFDVAYRVYLVGFAGLIAVVVVSDAVQGLLGEDVTTESWVVRGPSILGIVVATSFALGLRSGADGGPVAIESADVRHVLLAPIDRRMVMARPISQRLRTIAFGAAVVGGVLAQLIAREFDEPRGGWAGAGALFGAVVGALFVTSAVIAHTLRVPRWLASLVGIAGIAWQSAAAWATWSGSASGVARIGPANLDGSLALWGVRQRGIDIVPIVLTLLMVAAAFALGGRLRIEPLVRRGQLVSQLRFAATAQDLRTVVLLRRQLRAEALRSTPWGERHRPTRPLPITPGRPAASATSTATGPSGRAVWRRGVASLRRLPLPRLARIATLAVAAGAFASLTVSSSPLFGLGLLATLFLVGLEVIEPLAQEVDRPNLTERLPVERGWLFSRHLMAPAVLLAIVAMFGVVGAALFDPGHAAAAVALAVPVAFAGAAGPIVAAVRDAPAPIGAQSTTLLGGPRGSDSPFVPPEFAGASTVFSAALPIALSAAGTLPVFAMRVSATPGTVVRSAIGVTLFVTMVVLWIQRRDAWGAKVRAFIAEGQAAAR